MQLQIHCPHCTSQLAVPEDAAGRKARCPNCRQTFRVPDPQDLMEDSVTCWLEGIEDDQKSATGAPAPGDEADDAPKPGNRKPTPPTRPLKSTKPMKPAAIPPAPRPPAPPAPPAPPPSPASQSAASKPPKPLRISLDGKAVYEVRSAIKSSQPPPRDPDEERYSKPIEPPKPPKPRPAAEASAHPAGEVRIEVTDVSAVGVTIAFTSRLMMRPAFRASMPLSCILCQTDDTEQLVARPLGWIDKATGRMVDPGQIETLYAIDVPARQTPREIVASMRTIDELNNPFNQPMPYYICKACAPKVTYVHATASSLPTGVLCEVRIPNGLYALRWLGRVNGVCDDDYEQLESRVMSFSDAAWRSIDEVVRQRLAGWFTFQPGEQYVDYFPDSDFAKKDAGLAGIVLTDRRLLYCKYHAHGEIPLEATHGYLVVQADGSFDNIRFDADGGHKKLVRLRRPDTDRLVEAITNSGAPLAIHVA